MLLWCSFVIFFDYKLGSHLLAAAETTSYPSTTATIKESHLSSRRGSRGGTIWDADVSYSFSVNNQTFTSTAINKGNAGLSKRSAAEYTLALFPVGKQVPAYYNPANPQEAVLMPGIQGDDLLFPLGLLPFNMVVVLCALRAVGYAKLGPFKRLPLAVETWDTTGQLRLRLNNTQPIMTPIILAGLGGIASLIIIAPAAYSPIPIHVPIIIAAGIAVAAASAYALHRWLVLSGRDDLTLGRTTMTVTFPRSVKKLAGRTVPYSDIESIRMVNGKWRQKGGGYLSWKVQAKLMGEEVPHTLVERGNYKGLEALTLALRTELALPEQSVA
jgi:hypothetical protein